MPLPEVEIRSGWWAWAASALCFIDPEFQNVILLSVSVMFICTASGTIGNIEETVLAAITRHDRSFTINGYTSQGIINSVFAVCNWASPPIVALLEAKWSMVIGGSMYILFSLVFLWPITWLVYGMSVAAGFGSALFWTAQGNYLTLCSTPETIARNSGVFWCILQFSMFFGNCLVFWEFRGTEIDTERRLIIFSVLALFATAGVLCLCCLRRPARTPARMTGSLSIQESSEEHRNGNEQGTSPLEAIKTSVRLFGRKEMVLLFTIFFYTGLEGCFIWEVYSSSIGFTGGFGVDANRLVGLCGVIIGIGEIFGGALFSVLAGGTFKIGRDTIAFLGFVCHTLAYYLIYLNLPSASPLGYTMDTSFMDPPSEFVAMFCALLLGFGDSCFNTQLYSILGDVFHDESAPAFSLFLFTQSTAAAIGFFSSTSVPLHVQLVILQLFCTFGTLTFFLAEWEGQVKTKKLEGLRCDYAILVQEEEENANEIA